MKKPYNLKVSVSGVRGIVGETFTPSLVAGFAAAFGEYVGRGKVVVGRDTRPTGPMVEHAVIAGLLSVGCQPVLIDIAPTPTVQIVVDSLNANGGIAITASHNPVEWNALKFISRSGIFLNYNEAAELLDVYNQPDRRYMYEKDFRNIHTQDNPFELHEKRIFKHVDCEKIRSRKFTVAVDCCNGVGAVFSRPFLEKLGCKVISVNDEPDGIFRRKPEPVAENLTDLSEAVVNNKCDLGVAQDPDGDRIAFLDSNGEPVGEQYSLVLAAEHVLSKTPGNTVVNIQTTKAFDDIAKKYGCPVTYSKVGEINVTEKMLAQNAVIGGEGSSGGVIWPAVHPCRDSFTAMALALEMMAEREMSFTDIANTMPRYYSENRKFKCSAEKAQTLVRKLIRKYAGDNPITLDGLRINWDDAWVLIRPSNTEPVIRMTVEARNPERTAKLLAEFEQEISAAISG